MDTYRIVFNVIITFSAILSKSGKGIVKICNYDISVFLFFTIVHKTSCFVLIDAEENNFRGRRFGK